LFVDSLLLFGCSSACVPCLFSSPPLPCGCRQSILKHLAAVLTLTSSHIFLLLPQAVKVGDLCAVHPPAGDDYPFWIGRVVQLLAGTRFKVHTFCTNKRNHADAAAGVWKPEYDTSQAAGMQDPITIDVDASSMIWYGFHLYRTLRPLKKVDTWQQGGKLSASDAADIIALRDQQNDA
jgi:hypothetical protein